MIAALFALAAAMVIGGAAAVVQGFPYVRLESGLAMVIGGAVAASSGTILLGLGVVALALRRVERAVRSPAAPAAPARAPDQSAPPVTTPPAAEGRPRLPPVPAFLVAPAAEASSEAGRPRIEPRLDAGAPTLAGPAAAEPELPMPGLTPAPPEPELAAPEPQPEPHAPAAGIAPEDDLFAAPEAPPPEAQTRASGPPHEAPALRSSLDGEAPPPETEPEPERVVVGRYSSGGNTYVMFADGSIEADTPRGRFTFASLDELKSFVEGGGEAAARGAA